jgi:8-oxo-dGTP diphosphatase
MIPRIGESVRPDIPYQRRPGAYAILVRDARVLLTHQMEPVPEFQLPGGGVDPGEQVLPALHREILEETGWRAGRLQRLGAFRRFTYMPDYALWAEKLCHVYLGRPTLRLGPPIEDGHSAVWVSFENAIDLVGNDGDRMFLRRVLLR